MTPETRLAELHRQLRLVHGSFLDEYPEQLMAAQFIPPDARVLEIGGNIGRNSCVIAALLDDSSNLVVLECDATAAQQLRDNRDANGQKFRICHSALSRRPLTQQGINTKPADVAPAGWKPVPTMTWEQLRRVHPLEFDTLVLDCEGAIYYILQDEPNFLQPFRRVLIENDFDDWEHKRYVDAQLERHGLRCVYRKDGGWGPCKHCFYEVWAKGTDKVGGSDAEHSGEHSAAKGTDKVSGSDAEDSGEDSVCVYTVYHATLYPSNFEGYSTKELREWFRLYAANEAVPKDFPDTKSLPPVIKEWELPWHDPLQQMNKMFNNSAMWHVWRNADSLPTTQFVGFSQYDIAIPRDSLRDFLRMTSHPRRVGYMFPYAWDAFRLDEALPLQFWDSLDLPVKLHELMAGRPAPLLHAAILPREGFEAMMEWLDAAKGTIVRALGHDVRHLAGTLERAMALWIAAHVHCGQLGPACHLKGCVHSPEQRLPDQYRGIP